MTVKRIEFSESLGVGIKNRVDLNLILDDAGSNSIQNIKL